jgi:preprotein translocase subunit SecD
VSLRWRAILVSASVLLLGWYAAASFVPASVRKESAWLPDQGMRLGLDLQGGIHWVLGPDLSAAIEHELDVLRASLREGLEEKKIATSRIAVDAGRLVVEASRPEDVPAIREFASDLQVLQTPAEDGTKLSFALTSEWEVEVRKRAIEQILEVVRRRVDDPIQGIPESVVTRQGDDRVLVQIPGGQLDREQARKLLRQTGFLEFKLVIDQAPTEELLRKKYEKDGLPTDTLIAIEKEKGGDRVLGAYLVSKSADLTGEYLTDARSSVDPRYGWVVNFTFNSEGAARFGKLTGENVGKQLGILLDGQIYSAPNLQTRIGGGRGFIHGRFDSQSAADLAVILRAGSLPIPVKIEEERTIGPALGADSIRHGMQASIASLLAVLVFAVVYYRLSGVYATVAISVGMITIIGLMGMASATLTMPGIAGLVLTVGMAIDGNVLIFERIREELRRGKTPRAAIQAGFRRALLPILDGNITTMITALVLYQYGTGPIKGFAVTLAIGLVATVFQAVVVNRMLFAIYPGNRPVAELSI